MNKLLKYAIQRYGKVNTRRGVASRPSGGMRGRSAPTHTPHTKESVVKSIVADHLQKIMRK
jgi:hypothetical protein